MADVANISLYNWHSPTNYLLVKEKKQNKYLKNQIICILEIFRQVLFTMPGNARHILNNFFKTNIDDHFFNAHIQRQFFDQLRILIPFLKI